MQALPLLGWHCITDLQPQHSFLGCDLNSHSHTLFCFLSCEKVIRKQKLMRVTHLCRKEMN